MIHPCDNCNKPVELPIEEMNRRKNTNKGGRVFCTRSCTSSFYHPSNVAKKAINLTPPNLVGDDTPVEGIAVQALPKSEVGGRGGGEAQFKSFDKENEMVTQGINPEEKVPAQSLTAQDVVSIVTEVVKGLMPVQAAPSTPVMTSAPMTMQPSGKIVFTPGAGTVPTAPAVNTRGLDDSIPLALCDATLASIPIGIDPNQVWYLQGDGTRVVVPRDQQNACQVIGTEHRFMMIAASTEANAGQYFVSANACYRCRSTKPELVTTTNTGGWYSKGYMTLRNIANNYAQDIKNHGNTRQNGEVMDFSINGMLPSQLTSDQYQALVIQLHPLNGTVTTDVVVAPSTSTFNDDVIEAPF